MRGINAKYARNRRRTRPIVTFDVLRIKHAIDLLTQARTALDLAQCYAAKNAVSRALTSTLGAERHARGLLARREAESDKELDRILAGANR